MSIKCVHDTVQLGQRKFLLFVLLIVYGDFVSPEETSSVPGQSSQKNHDDHSEYASNSSQGDNETVSLASSSLEPVYYASGYPGGAGENQQTLSFYNDFNNNDQQQQPPQPNYLDDPAANPPGGPLYAVVGPQGIIHQGARQPYLEPDNYPSLLMRPPEADLSSLRMQQSHHRNHRGQPPILNPPYQSQIIKAPKKTYLDHLLTSDGRQQQQQQQRLQPMKSGSNSYQHRKPLNFSTALDSGQVLLSKQMKASGGPRSAALEAISLKELRAILGRLKPLEVQDSEADATTDDEDNSGGDEEDENNAEDATGKEDLPVVKRHKEKLEKIVPNESFYDNSEHPAREESVLQERHPMTGEDDLQFLKNLINIDERAPRAPISYELPETTSPVQERLPQVVGPTGPMLPSESNSNEKTRGVQNESNKVESSIPIDKLVDHLMSNSRLATFGVQHDDLSGKNSENEDEDDGNSSNGDSGSGGSSSDDDDDDDEALDGGEEDEDDPEIESQEADESTLRGLRVMPNASSAVPEVYSPLANRTDNWIPMDSIQMVKSEKSVKAGDRQQQQHEEDEKDKRKKKRKRKRKRKKRRRRRRKKKASVFGLVVGNRMLNRTEVIQLIRILNKMANKGKPSKERDASRKLLRFLIKLVLEEYKKDSRKKKAKKERQSSSNKSGSKDPIKDLLRSVLMGPIDMKNKNSTNDTSLELRPLPVVKVRPETTTVAPETRSNATEEEHKESKEEPAVKESKEDTTKDKEKRLKGLSELSDELENYFDNDFFEDLADKKATNNNNNSSEKISSNEEEPKLNITAPVKRRRASRNYYRHQVPIYGRRRNVDSDGDDIDPDLDREQMSQQPEPTRRRYVKRRRPSNYSGRRPLNGRRRRKMGPSRRRQSRPREDPDEAEPEDDRDVDEQPQEPPEREQTSDQRSKNDRDESPTSDHEEQPPEASSNKVDEEPHEENTDEKVDEAPPEQVEPDDGDAVAAGDSDKILPENEPVSENPPSHDKGNRKRKKQRGKQRRPNNGAKNKRKRNKSNRRRMAESRYEIPAPIVAGQPPASVNYNLSSVTLPKTQKRKPANESQMVDDYGINKDILSSDNQTKPATSNTKRSLLKPNKKTGGNKSVKDYETSLNKKRKDRSTKTKSATKEKRKTKSKHKPKESGRAKDPPRDDSDLDYYNESSSYREYCDEDGKCKIDSKTSRPQKSVG